MSVLGLRGKGGRHSARRAAPLSTLPALLLHTTKLQSRGVLIWGAALGLYSAALTASFTTFSGDAGQMEQLMDAYPQGLKEAFGLTAFGTIEGFMDVQVFNLAPLALAFFTVLAAANAIAGAEERGAIDVLLGNPLPRWQLVVGNFLATAVSLLGILAISTLLTWSVATLMDTGLAFGDAARGFLNLWPICVLFGGLAALCSALFRRKALAVAVPAAVLFAMYLLDTIGNVSKDVGDYQPASAFHYYGSAIQDGMDWTNFGGLAAVACVLVLLAVLAFQRRDIYT